MKKNNLRALNNQLDSLGFGTRSMLNQQLETMLGKGLSAFELCTEAFFDTYSRVDAKLYFVREGTSQTYRFTQYQAVVVYAGYSDKKTEQTFVITDGQGFTFKEAYNLLQGRAVFKTLYRKSGKPYETWVRLELDHKKKTKKGSHQFHYYSPRRYNLQAMLARHSIRQMQYETLAATLLRSLQRGNVVPVNVDGPTLFGRIWIAADPANNTLKTESAANYYHIVPPTSIRDDNQS